MENLGAKEGAGFRLGEDSSTLRLTTGVMLTSAGV